MDGQTIHKILDAAMQMITMRPILQVPSVTTEEMTIEMER
jgi:hypothetical protein